MKIYQAKKWVKIQRTLAVIIMATSTMFLVFTALKSIYFSMNGDATAFASISQGIQRGIYFIYQRTQFLSWFWETAPIFTPKVLNTSGNFGLLFIAVCGAIGRIIWDSATNLSNRISKTILKVEEIGWERELMKQNGQIQTEKVDLLQINIDLKQEDQWYTRPIGLVLLGIAVAVLGQLANLKFGLVSP